MTKVVRTRKTNARLLASRLGRPSSLLISALCSLPGVASAEDPPEATPYFTDKTTTNFPSTVENGLQCPVIPAGEDPEDWPGPGCYTSWLVVTDIDNDADPDILFANGGRYYSLGYAEESTVFLNDGTGAFQNVTTSKFGGASSRLRQLSVGDVTGDGLPDIYQPGGYGADLDKLWIQQDDGSFVNKADLLLPGKLKSLAGSSHLGDLDGDGDLDLIVADWGVPPLTRGAQPGNTWVYLNDGAGGFAQQPTNVIPPPMRSIQNLGSNGKADPNDHGWGRTPIDIDMADIDGDFDLDIIVNHRNGQSRLFVNDGTAHFDDHTGANETLNYPYKLGPYVYNQELCDFDLDGDLDMFLDNAGPKPAGGEGNFSQVLVNDGTGHFADESATRLFGEPGGDDNAVKCADFDGDGYYDLFVASLTVPGEKVLINDGTGKWTYVSGALPSLTLGGAIEDDATLGVDIADLDGDGLLDIVTGQGEGGKSWMDRIYLGSDNSKPDVTPPAFRKVEEVVAVPGEPTVIRFGVRDRVTSETGQMIKSAVFTYDTGSTSETLPATFVGGDLFRAVIPAQPNGTTLKIKLEITDHANLTTTKDIELLVGTIVTPEPDAGTPDAGMSGGDGDGDAPAPGDGDGDAPAPGDGDGDAPAPTADGGISCDVPDAGAPDDDDSSDDCSVSSPGLPGHGNLMAGLIAGLAMMFRSRQLRRRARAQK
ncbi:MAG: VCBS repeat-containing protein [Myxococcales bacterium]